MGAEDYRGPRRRKGEPDYAGGDHEDAPYEGPRRRKDDNGVHITGPSWIGSMSFSGAYTIPALALVIVAAGSGASTWLSYKAYLAQTEVISITRRSAETEHRRISAEIEEQNEISRQTLCILALLDPKERSTALRHGDVCHWLGVRSTRRPLVRDDPSKE